MYRIRYNVNMKIIRQYTLANGKSPFAISMKKFDKAIRARIEMRLKRIENGNYGDVKRLDEYLYELRCKFGNGIRIYFYEIDNTIILLLCAGDKASQSKDIENAKLYIKDFIERVENG